MKKTIKYFTKGTVLWRYRRTKPEIAENEFTEVNIEVADTKEQLLDNANSSLLYFKGKATNQDIIGIALDIQVQTTVEIDGDDYVNVRKEIDSVGELTAEEHDLLERRIIGIKS